MNDTIQAKFAVLKAAVLSALSKPTTYKVVVAVGLLAFGLGACAF